MVGKATSMNKNFNKTKKNMDFNKPNIEEEEENVIFF